MADFHGLCFLAVVPLCFCSHATARRHRWLYPTAREAGKCSPAVCQKRRNDSGNQLGHTELEEVVTPLGWLLWPGAFSLTFTLIFLMASWDSQAFVAVYCHYSMPCLCVVLLTVLFHQSASYYLITFFLISQSYFLTYLRPGCELYEGKACVCHVHRCIPSA